MCLCSGIIVDNGTKVPLYLTSVVYLKSVMNPFPTMEIGSWMKLDHSEELLSRKSENSFAMSFSGRCFLKINEWIQSGCFVLKPFFLIRESVSAFFFDTLIFSASMLSNTCCSYWELVIKCSWESWSLSCRSFCFKASLLMFAWSMFCHLCLLLSSFLYSFAVFCLYLTARSRTFNCSSLGSSINHFMVWFFLTWTRLERAIWCKLGLAVV